MEQLSESKQTYIKTIYLLSRRRPGQVRKVDIANELGYSKPGVTTAIQRLIREEYVSIVNGSVTLTESGMRIAEKQLEKSAVLAALFRSLGADSRTAAENASRAESAIGDNLIDIIKESLKDTSVPCRQLP